MRHLAWFLLVPLLAAALLPLPAGFAEDQEASEAADLFRQAWWLETGAGDLEKARALYSQACSAQGSEEIRARAHYRLAIVLQRMGRTEDAMRRLETLSKDFPNQRDLLTKAKARLEEWSGEDLRDYFSDWYRRYQYSPAFQSKIVDLVLQLGAPDDKVSSAAREELLTIGAPALPALREHTRSANQKLQDAVVGLLLRLGDMPPPAVLFDTSSWQMDRQFWTRLVASEGSQRERFREAAKAHADDRRAAWILAVLDGPAAIVDVLAASDNKRDYLHRFLLPLLNNMPVPAEVQARLRALPLEEAASGFIRAGTAGFLVTNHDWETGASGPFGFTESDFLAWAGANDLEVRQVVWRFMAESYARDPRAWRVPAERIRRFEATPDEQQRLVMALLGQLRRTDPSVDTKLAVDALILAFQQSGHSMNNFRALAAAEYVSLPGSPVVPRRASARAIGEATGNRVRNLPMYWWQATRSDPEEFDVLVGWIRSAADASVRAEALKLAAYQMRTGIDRLMAPFEDEALRVELRKTLFQNLRNNPALEALDWDLPSLTRLVEAADPKYEKWMRRKWRTRLAGTTVEMESTFSNDVSEVLFRLLHNRFIRAKLFEAAAAAPQRFPSDLWLLLGPDWARAPENRARGRSYLADGWKRWTPAQKEAGLRVFLSEQLVGRGDVELNALLRSFLEDPELGVGGRQTAAFALSDLTLADVQGAFDLTKPEEARPAVDLLNQLPRTPETYAAFAGLLDENTTSDVIVDRIVNAFRHGPEEVLPDLVTRLLRVRPEARGAQLATEVLTKRSKPEDLPLWRLALQHPTAGTRVAAAQALGNLYDGASIRALAERVDDPDPKVRDAALKSLERIETIEKQKKRWRDFAKGEAPAPGK